MDIDLILRIMREASMLTLLLSGPAVLAAMAVGLLVSLVQAATQLQEQTLTVVPKIVAIYAVLAIAGLWMVRELAMFAISIMEYIPRVS